MSAFLYYEDVMFKGRLSRKNFILGTLLPFILISIVFSFVLALLNAERQQAQEATMQEQMQEQQLNQTIAHYTTDATSSGEASTTQ